MKFRDSYKLFMLIALTIVLQGRSAGPGNVANLQVTGAPGSSGNMGTCGNSGCHTSGAFNPSLTLTLLDANTLEAVDAYVPGNKYQVRLNFSADAGVQEYGFQAVVLDDNNENIGSWDDISLPPAIQITELGGRSYIEHNSPSPNDVWGVEWTAPEAGTGDMTIYAAGIAANNNGNSGGDGVASSSVTIPEDLSNSASQVEQNFAALSIAPNPIVDWTRLNITSQVSGEFQLSIVSATGQLVLSKKINLQTGQNEEELQLSNLQSGLYFLHLTSQDQIITHKLIKS